MSKTKILKEFDKLNETLKGKEYTTVGILKNKILLSNALDQTREETIREVEEMLSKIVLKDLSGKWSEEVIDFSTSIVDATVLKIKQSLRLLINK